MNDNELKIIAALMILYGKDKMMFTQKDLEGVFSLVGVTITERYVNGTTEVYVQINSVL